MRRMLPLLPKAIVDKSGDELRQAWGVTPGYWVWSTRIRILFVIDGRITLTSDAFNFGLGLVLDTLRTPFSWWTSFTVDVAKREKVEPGDPAYAGLEYDEFRFTNPGFDINAYGQVWFFGDNPSADDDTDAEIPGGLPLDDAELKLVAEWMDRGGGVFAAGDHSILGASMCSRIPRVRTMRRWKQQQGVPTKHGSTRHQTLQPTAQNELIQEGDTVLQPVELVQAPFPHPIFCSNEGLIDRFPDHMHEGEVVNDADVELDRPLDIPDYSRPEYPEVIPEVLASGLTDVGPLLQRPRPHVIAYGRTTNLYYKEPVVQPAVMASLLGPSVTGAFGVYKRFGLVSVYDGDLVHLGRVVVDSTWHHWFSLNLVGIKQAAPLAYEKMQAYYRNIAMWLATPAQRRGMLVAGIWGVLTSVAPMAFGKQDSPWKIGATILSVLPRTLTLCMLREVVAGFSDVRVLAATAPSAPPSPEPSWSKLPEEVLNRALVGGIGSALLGLALDHQAARARGERPRLDPEAIRRRAVDGVSRAQNLLTKFLDDAATAVDTLRDALAAGPVSAVDVQIPIDVRRLRVVAETLQFPDATDPALSGRHVTLTIRIKLDASVAAYKVFDDIDMPSLMAGGGIIVLSRDVGVIEVQTGERLSVEVRAGRWTTEEAEPEAIRFSDTLRGDASNWIGTITPARSQAWRLWYSIRDA